MPSRNTPSRADVAKGGPRCRAYQWSSGRQPRTKPSEGVLCCEGLFLPSAIPGADNEHTASVPALSIREHSRSCTVDTRNRPATGWQPDTLGKPPRWRTVTGIRASSSGMLDAARPYTTPCGLLKQPDKQKITFFAALKHWMPCRCIADNVPVMDRVLLSSDLSQRPKTKCMKERT